MSIKWYAGWVFPSTGTVQGYARLDDGSLAEFASEEEAWEFVKNVMVEHRRCDPGFVGAWSEEE